MAEFCGFEAPSPLGCLLCKVLKNVKLENLFSTYNLITYNLRRQYNYGNKIK